MPSVSLSGETGYQASSRGSSHNPAATTAIKKAVMAMRVLILRGAHRLAARINNTPMINGHPIIQTQAQAGF